MLNNNPVLKRGLKAFGASLLAAGLLHTVLSVLVSSLPAFGLNDVSLSLVTALLMALEKSLPTNL